MWKDDRKDDVFAEVISYGKRKKANDDNREMETFVFEAVDENKAAYKRNIAR